MRSDNTKKLIASLWGAMSALKDRPVSHLVHGDCLGWMRAQPDLSIDLIVTDPPYGLNIARTGSLTSTGTKFTPKAWDRARPPRAYFDEMRRISRNQVIFGGNYFADYLPPSRCWLAWWKNDGLPRLSFADCELAWTSFDRNARVFNCRWRGGIRDGGDARLPHPTQKPLSLMRWCIEEFSAPGDLILDPFLGTGTTVVAAHQLGRRYIGIENDGEYFEMAKDRLAGNEKPRA